MAWSLSECTWSMHLRGGKGWDGWQRLMEPREKTRVCPPPKFTQLLRIVNACDLLPPASSSWPFFTCKSLCQALCWNRNALKRKRLHAWRKDWVCLHSYSKQPMRSVMQDVHKMYQGILERNKCWLGRGILKKKKSFLKELALKSLEGKVDL